MNPGAVAAVDVFATLVAIPKMIVVYLDTKHPHTQGRKNIEGAFCARQSDILSSYSCVW